MIRTVRADELRPGDIMSTNGGTIETVVRLQGGGYEDEIAVTYRLEDGYQKFEYVEPERPVHLYTPDAT